jgi:hypothetical protein
LSGKNEMQALQGKGKKPNAGVSASVSRILLGIDQGMAPEGGLG